MFTGIFNTYYFPAILWDVESYKKAKKKMLKTVGKKWDNIKSLQQEIAQIYLKIKSLVIFLLDHIFYRYMNKIS